MKIEEKWAQGFFLSPSLEPNSPKFSVWVHSMKNPHRQVVSKYRVVVGEGFFISGRYEYFDLDPDLVF